MDLNHHVPSSIHFYNNGILKQSSKRIQNNTGIVLFSLEGDIDAKILIGFNDEDLFKDDKILEISNIIASKFVSSIVDTGGLSIELSPPTYLDAEERAFKALFIASQNYVSYEYKYELESQHKNSLIQLVYIPIPGGTG